MRASAMNCASPGWRISPTIAPIPIPRASRCWCGRSKIRFPAAPISAAFARGAACVPRRRRARRCSGARAIRTCCSTSDTARWASRSRAAAAGSWPTWPRAANRKSRSTALRSRECRRATRMNNRLSPAHAAIALAIAAFLLLFLIIPVVTVVYVAFTNSDGSLTLEHFFSFFQLTLMRESFYNSLYVGGMSVLLSSVISLPLAYFTMRFQFRGSVLIQTLGVLPLIMPPFVGAAAMQLLFGRNGSVNLILNDCCGFGIPFMEGLNGVIFVEALHYFPFILLNLTAVSYTHLRAHETPEH